MKLLSILVASVCTGIAAAQGIAIGFPFEGGNIEPGHELTVQVIRNVCGPLPSEIYIDEGDLSRTTSYHQ